jgi:hypothetical protein
MDLEAEHLRFPSGNLLNIRNITAGNGWFVSTRSKDLNGFTRLNAGHFDSAGISWMSLGTSVFS